MMWQTKRRVQLSPRLRVGVGRGYSKNPIFKMAGGLCLLLTLTTLTGMLFSGNRADQTSAGIPTVLSATEIAASQQAPEESITYNYTVQPGDTLFNISQRLETNVPWTTLAELNKLKPPFTLKPGQVIKVPNTK